jgi:predicted dehydrogenase
MDIGIYPVAWVRWVAGAQPSVVSARAETPLPGVDGRLEADLVFPSGASGHIVASMVERGGEHRSHLVVEGSEGTMRVDNPLAPQHGASLVVERQGSRVEHQVSQDTTYEHQLRAFRDAVVAGVPFPTTADEGVLNMALIDACYRAAGLEPRPTHP